MTRSPFDLDLDELPTTLPIFPLAGVLLLPRGRLPLNIFEPRYLNMTADALAGRRMIGMVQPQGPADGSEPPVFATGCAGRITAFSETDDGRFLITLTGVIRFHLGEELPTIRGYRRVMPDYTPFADDLSDREGTSTCDLPRPRLLASLRQYFAAQGMTANWDVIAETPDDRLITMLCMVCPFQPQEKQALLEARALSDRAHLLLALMEMALHEQPCPRDLPRH